MEDQKLGVRKDGGGSPKAAMEEMRTPGAAAQNGERTEEAERAGIRRRHSSNASSEKTESSVKGVLLAEEPPRKRFQIPRKSREKKALQPISCDSREFEEILKILHSSFLEGNSKIHFTFQSARLVHNEFLEKEFTEKRRQLKSEGRTDKELAESYGFLLVDDESQVQGICERGLLVGHSSITALGKPSMGVYLSKFADLLQTNPLKPGSKGSIFIFKVIKGKIKIVPDKFRNTQDSSFPSNALLDPAPKHECHTLKNINLVNSLLCYRAFERTQYYFYEYGFDEILKRPRHVCPYAVVSFGYKTDQPRPLSSPLLRPGSVSYSSERHNDRPSCVLWRGQLFCNKKLMCFASLKSSNGPFFPYKLPDKIDLEILMRLEQIKKRIPTLLFYKETHATSTEVVKGGICSRLYEVADKTRVSNDFQALLHKLEREQLALVKRMPDRGFLIIYFLTPMAAEYGSQSVKPPLHALFIYQHSRITMQSESHFNVQPYSMAENHEIMPEFMTFVGALHYALSKAKLDTSDDFNIVMEKHANLYLKRRAEGSNKRDYVLKEYKTFLDANKWLHVRPKVSESILPVVTSYLRGSDAYELPVEKAKELIMAHRRVQQFSPISDYEPMEDDFDPDKLHGLLSLIQNVKKNATTNPETDESLSSGVKRKLEDSPETQWKLPRYEDYAHQSRDYAMESTGSVSSLISALGGQDTDLRQENTESEPSQPEPIEAEPLVADPSQPLPPLEGEFCKGLFEKLSSSGLLDSIKKLLPEQDLTINQTLNMDVEASVSAALGSAGYDQSTYLEAQTMDHPESIATLGTSLADDMAVQKTEETVQKPAEEPVEEIVQGPYSSYASPVPSTPTEEVYQPQDSNSSNEESEFNWKLIPITGEEGRVSEDHVEYLRDENQQGLSLPEGQDVYSDITDVHSNDPRGPNICKRRSGYSPLEEYQRRKRRSSRNERTANSENTTRKEHDFLKTKHCQNGAIEKTVLEIYSSFAERLQGVLREKDISYTAVTTPILSSNEREVRLSDWLYGQASSISVQQYVDELRLKLDSVVNSSTRSSEMDKSIKESEVKEPSLHPVLLQNHVAESAHYSRNSGQTPLHSPASFHNGCVEQRPTNSIQDSPQAGSPVPAADSVPHASEDAIPHHLVKTTSPLSENLAASHTALAHLINQMNPEVFTNLVKIFTHVNKNIVKFYIHTNQEDNMICQEIKDYLIKLGNVQCSPQQFVINRAGSDKLLIIIQNEDIASSIHKIPSLITLKRQPCVSFAGVDSLEDLKNHTYNELFVSGGLIVSDDTVLNPDTITEDALKRFLQFLEEIDSPEGKWQWKIHCKFQKKLKELGRMNKTALNILTLLNIYQKKHLVEILAYHNCDSQNRQAPELDCLIKRQVENIQQRHLIFLTEKNESLFSSHAENGIVVTRMEEFMQNFTNLVGHHNSNEDNCLSQLVNQENKTALSEADVKEEEDMSLDSEDEIPPIEVCSTNVKQKPHSDDAMSQLESTEDSKNEESKKPPIVDPEFMQPITPVSTAGSTTGGDSNTAEESSNSYGDYDGRSLAIAPFNLLTHQTFLGSMLYRNQTSGENFFTGSYNQSVEQETFSHSEWDQK